MILLEIGVCASGTSAIRKTVFNLTNSCRYAIISTAKRYFFESLDFSLVSLKIPWLQASERLAPCSQFVAKTKKTPFYGPLTSGFAVHCVYSGLPISHGNRPNVPKPTRKNNFRRVQLPSAPLKPAQNRRFDPSVLHHAGDQSSRVIKCS